MAKGGPGKAHRKGITLAQLVRLFPDDHAAAEWFEGVFWGGERCCPKCGGLRTKPTKSGKPMPYWCPDCRKYFSVRTGTVMARSHISLQNWAFAIYLAVTNLKGVSSMKLHRDLGISQKAAWFMLHRIREALASNPGSFDGPVEVDETYVGGLEKNRHAKDKKNLGRGTAGKTAVVGAKDRESGQVAARVIEHTDKPTLQGFVDEHASEGAKMYTDDASAYGGSGREHETVKHSAKEYVRYLEGEKIHTNGVESFWSMLKRAHKGTFHRLSVKHLQRYVDEFVARHNVREMDTINQMAHVAAGMIGRRLMYRDLVADNGRSARAR